MTSQKELSDIARSLGRRGGKKTAERGKEYFALIGKKGAERRWGKTKKVFICEDCGEEVEGDMRQEYDKLMEASPDTKLENIRLVCTTCYDKKWRNDQN